MAEYEALHFFLLVFCSKEDGILEKEQVTSWYYSSPGRSEVKLVTMKYCKIPEGGV